MRLLLLGICLLFFSNIYSQSFSLLPDEHYNAALDIMSAKIKKEYIYSFVVKKKNILDSVLVAIIHYNKDGKIIVWEQQNHIIRYNYNANGQVIKGIKESKDSKMVVSSTTYEYDSSEKMIYQYDYSRDTARPTTAKHKIYDSFEPYQVKQLQTKLNNGKFYTSREYYYDEQGRLIREDGLDQAGNRNYAYITEYNDKNHIQSVFLENSEGETIQSETTFNNNAQRIKHKTYIKVPVFISPGYDENRLQVRTQHYTYYNNRILYEWNTTIDGQIVQLTRHYYYQD